MRFLPILILHITGGIVSILSGAVAAILRKGSHRHAIAGRVFVVAMLTMASCGTFLAIVKSQPGNILGGTVMLYMIATAWMTARHPEKSARELFDWGALLYALTLEAIFLGSGVKALRSPIGMAWGYGPALYFTWAGVILLCIVGDIRMLARGGIFGVQRIARHLWRMCFAFFIASGSFFLGQQKVMPKFIQGSPFLFVPAFLPLLLLISWLVRVRVTAEYKRTSAPPRSPARSTQRSTCLRRTSNFRLCDTESDAVPAPIRVGRQRSKVREGEPHHRHRSRHRVERRPLLALQFRLPARCLPLCHV